MPLICDSTANSDADIPTCSRWEWGHSVSFGTNHPLNTYPGRAHTDAGHSSAKDQLTGQNVAVKKIMKPFSTPVLSKRTYRELKLLKHLKHENVCTWSFVVCLGWR